MLQIKQLNTDRLDDLELRKIRGGDAEDHWQGYANGELRIGKTIRSDEKNVVAISFQDADSDTVKGSIVIIDGETYTFF